MGGGGGGPWFFHTFRSPFRGVIIYWGRTTKLMENNIDTNEYSFPLSTIKEKHGPPPNSIPHQKYNSSLIYVSNILKAVILTAVRKAVAISTINFILIL